MAVEHLHGCLATHDRTVPVHETFHGKTVWRGDVEIFKLTNHPKANFAYSWSYREGPDDSTERFVSVLDLPPVDSATTAVRVAIADQLRNRR